MSVSDRPVPESKRQRVGTNARLSILDTPANNDIWNQGLDQAMEQVLPETIEDVSQFALMIGACYLRSHNDLFVPSIASPFDVPPAQAHIPTQVDPLTHTHHFHLH